MKCKILKENSCLNRYLQKKEKKAVHTEIARKGDANVYVISFPVVFATHRARVAAP